MIFSTTSWKRVGTGESQYEAEKVTPYELNPKRISGKSRYQKKEQIRMVPRHSLLAEMQGVFLGGFLNERIQTTNKYKYA